MEKEITKKKNVIYGLTKVYYDYYRFHETIVYSKNKRKLIKHYSQLKSDYPLQEYNVNDELCNHLDNETITHYWIQEMELI